MIVSIDGLRPEFYLDGRWPAPTLQMMAREGAHAQLVRPGFPSVTFPSHTTILTGALPARHGVYYNAPFEPAGQTGRWYWEASSIRVPTLWHAVRAAGLKSGSVKWPVSLGAPIDYDLPDVWSLDPDVPAVEAIRRHAQPAGFMEEVERNATGKLHGSNFTSGHLASVIRSGQIASYLLETYRPALITLHLISTDTFQHQDGRESERVRRAVAASDRAIADVLETAERLKILERTAFIVTGDHGFSDVHSRLAPNVWLTAAGLRRETADRGNWQATFYGGFLHLRDQNDTTTAARVREIIASRPDAERRLFRVVEREELDRIGADPRVPFALTTIPGVSMSDAATGAAVAAAQGGTHGFYPDFPEIHTGFIGWGAGFRKGAVVPVMGLEDVAPLVAALLGLRFEAPDGILLPGVLQR